jgi:stage V sporulation protein SpoVS
MFHHEVLHKKETFDFTAFGELLIGRTAKALSIAQDFSPDINIPGKIFFVPYLFDTPNKRREEIPSARFIIFSQEHKSEPVHDIVEEIRMASTSVPESVAKTIHHFYLQKINHVKLRCVGETPSSKAVLAMAVFNENVKDHKLAAWLSNERISDGHRSNDRTIRAIVFNVCVLKANETPLPN